jgi:hypothetical protein
MVWGTVSPVASVMTLHTKFLPTHSQVNKSPWKENRTFQSQNISGSQVICVPTFIIIRWSLIIEYIEYYCRVTTKKGTFYKTLMKYKWRLVVYYTGNRNTIATICTTFTIKLTLKKAIKTITIQWIYLQEKNTRIAFNLDEE